MNKREEICRWCWFVAAATALVIVWLMLEWAGAAQAHKMAAAEGIPEYVYQSGCCGKDDCREVESKDVALTENGYKFSTTEAPNKEPFEINEGEPGLRDSPDGKYWACFNIITTRCTGGGGFGGESGNCVTDKTIPWTLRCFFRPVNV